LIQPVLSEQKIIGLREALVVQEPVGDLYLLDTHNKVMRVLDQAEALTQRYHVVVANPPYLSAKGMNGSLKALMGNTYPAFKSDLFSAFIVRASSLSQLGGHLGYMSPNVWMYISSHVDLRNHLLLDQVLTGLIELPLTGFAGATVQICAFTFRNCTYHKASAVFIRLVDFLGVDKMSLKVKEAITNNQCGWFYRLEVSELLKISGSPIAYWISPEIRESFAMRKVSEIADTRVGCQTSDNNRFMRFWFECSGNRISTQSPTREASKKSGAKWFPYNKGGEFRRWYGNVIHVVNWANDGEEIFEYARALYGSPTRTVKNGAYYFRESVTWSKVSSGAPSFRYQPSGSIFDVAGASVFFENSRAGKHLLGLLNSAPSTKFLSVLSPTVNFETTQIGALPVPEIDQSMTNDSVQIVDLLISMARADWDNFETSWDFRDQPLLRSGLKDATLAASWRNWEAASTTAIRRMQELETENNRMFIEAYGLEGELQPEVPLEQITLARPEVGKDIRDFISYAVGCMFGRYALEEPGLILANQGETLEDYLKRVPAPSFPADEDNVIPVLDGEWFSDDIVERFKQFLRITFGEASYVDNLRFIEAALGTDTKPKSLRDYFVKDFYNDHIKRYKKRPVYWMFTSPKGSFNALIYMHRYRPDTVSVVLNNYLREFRTKLVAHKAHLEAVSISAGSSQADKTKALKEIEKVSKAIVELEDYERDVLYPLATEKLAIDLDDGVKVNYLKFGSALKKIPGLEAKED
jgi:hypothetical protein